MEEYRNIFDNYEVSNIGNVRRLLITGEYKLLSCSIGNRGYKYFQLNRDRKRQNYLIHHLVAKLFIGERPEGYVIDHIDRNKLNNNVSNLRYVLQRENLCNTDRYRADILETGKERANRFVRESYKRNGGKTEKQKEENRVYMYKKDAIRCIKYLFEGF